MRLALEKKREPFEDQGQGTRALTRRDHCAVKWREAARFPAHRIGQAATLDDTRMDAVEDRADMIALGLACDGPQCLFERSHE